MHIKLRKRKILTINSFLYFILFSVLIILAVQYCDTRDYYVYYTEYNALKNSGFRRQIWEPGFDFLCLIFIKLGIDFELFYIIYIVTVLLLLHRFFKTYAKNSIFTLILYSIFPYINYLQQIRSALTIVIIFNMLEYLIKSQELRSTKGVKFTLVIVLLCTIHSSNIAYLIFLLPLFMNKNAIKRVTVFLYVLIPVSIKIIFPLIARFLERFEIFARLLSGMNKNIFFSGDIIFNLLIHGMLLVVFIYLDTVEDIGRESFVDEQLYKYSLMVMLLATLCCVSQAAYRITALALPIIYVTVYTLTKSIKNSINKMLLRTSAFLVSVMYFMVYWGPLNQNMNYLLMNEMWKIRP